MKVYVVTGTFELDEHYFKTIIGVFGSKDKAQEAQRNEDRYIITKEENDIHDWEQNYGLEIGAEFYYDYKSMSEVEIDKIENVRIL